MSQKITSSVQMTAKEFHDFAVFDLFRHQKRWQRPTVFTAILLVSAGICMTQIGKRDGAALLTAVLAIIAIGLPAVYFGTFFYNLSKQIKKLNFPRPFYRVELEGDQMNVWMAGQQDKAEPTNRYGLSSLHCAYRTESAVYLYVQPAQAYLLSENLEKFWAALNSALPAEKLHDCRSKKA